MSKAVRQHTRRKYPPNGGGGQPDPRPGWTAGVAFRARLGWVIIRTDGQPSRRGQAVTAASEATGDVGGERKTTLSGAVRSAVLEATRAERGIPSKEELLLLLSEAARTGSVPAMKELLRHHQHQGPGRKRRDPLDRFDELAARRER